MQILRGLLLMMLIAALLLGLALGEEQAVLMTASGESFAFTIQDIADRNDETVISVRCENATDNPLTFGWSHVSVMGCMIDPLWAVTVDAQGILEAEVCFENEQLAAMGIPSADEITFTLTVLDAFSWDHGMLLEQAFTVYPQGTSPTLPDRLRTAEETVLIEDDDLLLAVLHTELTPFTGYVMSVCVENRTGQDAMVLIGNAVLNGTPVELAWSDEVYAGKRLYAQIVVPQYQLTLAQAETVEELSFSLRLNDMEDWLLPVIKQYDVALTPAV